MSLRSRLAAAEDALGTRPAGRRCATPQDVLAAVRAGVPIDRTDIGTMNAAAKLMALHVAALPATVECRKHWEGARP